MLTGALLATHRVVGSPCFDRKAPVPVDLEVDEDHIYKYVWTCLVEYRHYGDERYAEEVRRFRENQLVPAHYAQTEL